MNAAVYNQHSLTDQQRLNNHKLLKHKQDKGRKQGKKDRRPDKTANREGPNTKTAIINQSKHPPDPETTKRQVDHMEQTKGKIKERNQRKKELKTRETFYNNFNQL